MRLAAIVIVIGISGGALFAADTDLQERGRHEEQRACVACHSLRLIDSQRLSVTAWGKEIDKMVGWGAVVTDRQLLLDYLSQQGSDSKPVPVPELSGEGTTPPPHPHP